MLGFLKATNCVFSKKVNQQFTNYNITLVNKAEQINIVDWNNVLQKQHNYLSIKYLNTLEKSLPDGVTSIYIIVYENKIPIFITYFQLYTFTKEQLNALKNPIKCQNFLLKNLRSIIQNTAVKIIQFKKMQLLVMGNILQTGNYTYLTNSKKIDKIIEVVICEIKQYNKVDAIILKDIITNEAEVDFTHQRFLSFYTQPNMMLSINKEWKKFDDYIASFNKKYKKRWKNANAKFSAIIQKEFTFEDTYKYQKEMYTLFEHVYNNSSYKVNKIKSNYFLEFQKQFENKFKIIGYFLQNKLIAFASYFIDNNNIEANYIGIDYTYNDDYKLYQNILYNYVQIAIENNSNKLYLSRTGLEIKSSIGAIPTFLQNFVRVENSMLHNFIKPIFKNIKPEPFIQRNPFN